MAWPLCTLAGAAGIVAMAPMHLGAAARPAHDAVAHLKASPVDATAKAAAPVASSAAGNSAVFASEVTPVGDTGSPVAIRMGLVAFKTSTAAPAAASAAPPPAPTVIPDTVTPVERAEWTRVAECETHQNWTLQGATYSGGLGISNVNWSTYSYGTGFPADAGYATVDEQIMVAERIQFDPPDQYGCAGW
jgi:hypothetical protein